MAAPFVASAVLRTEPVKAWLSEQVVELVRSELGLVAHLGPIDVDVWSRAIRVDRATFDHPTQGRLASADAVVIKPSIAALIRGTIDLGEIGLVRPRARLVVQKRKLVNGPRLPTSSSSSDDIPLTRLLISHGAVTVDSDELADLALDDVTLRATVRYQRIVDAELDVARIRIDHAGGTETLDRTHLVVHRTPTVITVREAELRSIDFRVAARDFFVSVPFDSYGGHVEVSANLARLASLPLGVELPPLVGRVSVEADVRGRGDSPQGRAVVRASEVKVDQFGFGELELHVSGSRDLVRLDEGSVAHIVKGGGAVTLAGTVGLHGNMPLDVRLGVQSLQFAKLMDQLGVSENAIVDWVLSGEIALQGTLDPLTLSGPIRTQTHDFVVTRDAYHVHPRRTPIIQVPRARIVGGVSVRDDGIRFENLVADLALSRLHGSVFIGFHEVLGVHAWSTQLDVRDASPILEFPIGGVGAVNVDVGGTFDDPTVAGHVQFANFSFDTFPLGDVESDWHLEKEGLLARFPDIRAVKRDSRYHARDFVLDFSDHKFRIDTELDLERMTLADFYHVFHYETDERFTDYQATTRGRVGLVFTMGFPGDSPSGTLDTDIDLTVSDATLNGYAFQEGTFRGRWRWLDYERGYEGGELTIAQASLRKGAGSVSATGRMGLNGVLDVDAIADGLALRETEGISDRLTQLDGTYGVLARITGTLDVMHADLDVNLTNLAWAGHPLGDGRLYVRLTDPSDPWVQRARAWPIGGGPADEPCANARAGLAHGSWPADPLLHTREGLKPALSRPMAWLVCGSTLDDHVRVDLAIGRTKVFPLRGVLDLAALDLGAFLPHARGEASVGGRTSGRVTLWDGAMLADNTLVGAAQLDELRVGESNVELRNDGLVDVRFDRGAFRFERARFTGPSSHVVVTGGGSLVSGLSTTIDGEIDLGLLASLSPSVTEAAGHVAAHVNLTGPVQDPEVFGEATVTEGRVRVGAFPDALEDLAGRVTFSARRVVLEDFHAHAAGGDLALSGFAMLRGRALERFEIDVDARDLALVPMDGVELGFGGRAELAWQQGERIPTLRGTMRLDRVVYSRPIQVGQTLEELSRRSRAEVQNYDPAQDRIALDVRIVDETPIRVVNNLIDADVRIDDSERAFRVVGTDQRFGVLGTLVVPRGSVRFRNAEFLVNRGVVEFDDQFRIDPRFDLRATTEVRRAGGLSGPRWRITLHAHGSSDSFRLDTSAEPDMSQEDIILLLTVGMTRAEAEQLQAGNVGQAAALEALATVTGIDREVQRAIPIIDDFRVTSAYSLRTNRTEPQVSIGKRIAERVWLRASTFVSDSREMRASAEWQISNETSIQAVYDNVNTTTASQIGNLGVDLRWRLEFE